MRIFLSYPSEYLSDADIVSVRLRAAGHKVFFAPDELPTADGYDDRIRKAILNSDLVVFLLGPEFLAAGRYTLTELATTRKKWPSPANHVLPVLMRQIDIKQIPGYLRAISMLQPKGDAAAEIVEAVARFRIGIRSSFIAGLSATIVSLL
jgi:hypothetical protein